MLTLATLPSASSMLADITDWSSPLFDALLPFAVFAIGVVFGIFLIRFIIKVVYQAFHSQDAK